MSKGYEIGYKVKVIKETPSLNPYGQSSGYLIDVGTIGIVTGYNDRYNSKIEDDFAKIKIISGDTDLKDKEIWIKSSDFKNVVKLY